MVVRAMREAAASTGVGLAGQIVIGLCVPGRREAGGRRVVASVNVPGLVGESLDALVVEAVGDGARVVTVVSDARAAAADAASGLTPGAGRLLAISMGTGVGSCVLDGGRALEVSGESPGHLGQVDVSVVLADGTVPVGPDGGRGGLEAYVGLPALVSRLGGPAETVMERVGADDPAIEAVVRAIRIAHAIYRPQTVALLGGVGIGLARHGDVIRARVADGLTSVARERWSLVFGRDGFHAARGAARLAIQARNG